MTTYRISADVEVTTIKTTEMIVEADSPDEAQDIARMFLQVFPAATFNDNIKRAVVTKTNTPAPAMITFNGVKEVQMIHPPRLT